MIFHFHFFKYYKHRTYLAGATEIDVSSNGNNTKVRQRYPIRMAVTLAQSRYARISPHICILI